MGDRLRHTIAHIDPLIVIKQLSGKTVWLRRGVATKYIEKEQADAEDNTADTNG